MKRIEPLLVKTFNQYIDKQTYENRRSLGLSSLPLQISSEWIESIIFKACAV
jgi:hypothetical protein